MNDKDYDQLVQKQKKYFNTGATLDINFRINALKKLKTSIIKYQIKAEIALEKDLSKSEFETYTGELAGILMEINFHLKNIKKWAQDKKVKTPLFLKPAHSKIIHEPYGVTLILSPWNYPFQLAIMPLIAAISAGNTAIIKPSELTPNISSLLKEMISATFDEKYIAVVEGGVPETTELLKKRFDFIFFTGSTKVGKIVAEAAAKNLTPTILELGGKSPVILDNEKILKVCVKRIAMAKVSNAGQICVSPDYILLPEERKTEFIKIFTEVIEEFFSGNDPSKASTYEHMTKIINENNFQRIESLLTGEKILWGGNSFREELKLQPTLIDSGKVEDYVKNNKEKSALLKEEVFAPILPIITYKNLDEVIEYIRAGEKPLSLHLYSTNKNTIKKILKNISFGGGTINDSMTHLANNHLPFGGVGESGQGAYHGHTSFLSFSHQKSILYSKTWFDIKMRYMPYTEKKLKLLKKLFNTD